ncbi:uncharacterized protein Tco025E_03444 [Trypanosoma conorhini]|uniref:Uncharacterized protein n=1 Tax=Trypanosoma conorhini TaxID=83891 RepID=A0A3R7PCA7_9TRYP|nr:uncharacterized protein Tco025E_03444 [Trypanosoma conorhini]RNF21261.1 hypothetical protein Tco025E_03444 [Trypanosoma conorhini]
MRNVLTMFLEASADRGAWESALAAWRTAAVEGVAVSGSHALLLTRMLAQAGRWREASHVATNDAVVICPQRIAARRVAMLAARADVDGWGAACRLLQDARTRVEEHGGEQCSALQTELVGLAESFEHGVLPQLPAAQQEPWKKFVRDLCLGHRHNYKDAPLGVTRGGGGVGAAVEITNNEELLHIYRSPKSRSSWLGAIQLLASMPHPNAASVNITLGILSRQGRQQEAIDVISKFMAARGIHPTAVTVKAITEAANTMRSLPLATVLLSTPALRDKLTPSAAVPLVLTLQRFGEWRACLTWWNSLVPIPDSSVTLSKHGSKAELRRHLKLSSYVAVCVAQGGRWLESLAAMKDASVHNPSLAVLFALRALRVAGEWQAALELLQSNKEVWENSLVDLQVREVMMRQNAENWIPRDKLQLLRLRYRA